MGDSPLLAFVKSRHLLIAIAMKDDIEVKLKKKVSQTRKKDKQSDEIERLRVIHSRLEGENITEIGNWGYERTMAFVNKNIYYYSSWIKFNQQNKILQKKEMASMQME